MKKQRKVRLDSEVCVDLAGEEWREIVGYEGYDVSNLGRVRSRWNLKPIIKKFVVGRYGYCRINMKRNDGVMMTRYIHLLVAEAFLENSEGLPEVDHGDGNAENNAVGNLEWVTHKENIRRAMERRGNWLNGKGCRRVKYRRIDPVTRERLEYDSLKEAALAMGSKNGSSNIFNAAVSGRESYGFLWERVG